MMENNEETVTGISTCEVCDFNSAKRLFEAVGQNPPVKDLQFWFTGSGKLVMTLTAPASDSEFAAVVVVEIERAVINGYARRDFDKMFYAPFLVKKIV